MGEGDRLIRATARYEVWAAGDRVTKELTSTCASDPEQVRRFENEGRIVRRLAHPNILAIKEMRRSGPKIVQLLEPFDAADLLSLKSRITASRGDLPKDVILAIGAEIGRALEHAHQNDVYHGFIGPQCVLVAEDGRLKITDFLLGAGGPIEAEIARPGSLNAASDIAAVGRLLGWLIGGAEAIDKSEIRRRLADGDFVLEKTIVDADLALVVTRCTGKGAYASASALVAGCLTRSLDPSSALAMWRMALPREPTGSLALPMEAATALALPAIVDEEEPRTLPNRPAIEDPVEARYKILEPIGFGGMGTIHRAIQLAVGREVAIKTMHDDHDAGRVQRFHNEAKLVSQLRHPNTLRVFDFGQRDDGALFLVTELLHGEPLDSRITARGRLDPRTTVRIMIDIAEALAEAHGLGIIHRDLTPRNLFLDKVGDRERIKVLDFGLAKDSGSSPITQVGMIVGTPSYMSPEQACAEPMTPRSDIYNLGVTMYQCLAGELPFGGPSLALVLRQHVYDPPPPFADKGVSVPPVLEALVMKMLAKKPADRWESAAALRAALVAIEPTLDEPPAPPAPRVEIESWVGRELHSYKLTEEIGSGVASKVYRAVHTVLGRTAAIKVLNDIGLKHASMHKRLKREAQVLASLEHPNILRVQDFGVSPDGVPYLVLELIGGKTLRQVLTEQGGMQPLRALRIARQIVSAMALAHEKGVIHRDLKPGNVMLLGDASDDVKVLDFGLARVEGVDRSQLTRHDVLIGSPGYMAPEQIESPSEAGPLSDLYSLGCLMYALLAGDPPFRGSIAEVVEKQIRSAPPPLPSAGPLERLIMRLLEKKPADRPQSAPEVAAELDRIEATMTGAPGRPATITQPLIVPPVQPARRAPPGWALVLGAVLAMIAGVLVATQLVERPPGPVVPQIGR